VLFYFFDDVVTERIYCKYSVM